MRELEKPYEKFAHAYDRMMSNVDYVRWANYIEDLFRHYKCQPRKILEIACGTGALTVLLAERGYEMWGLDCAEGMLTVAREKAEKRHLDIPFIQGDMRNFELQQQFDAVLCIYDSINYAVDEDELESVFRSVSKHLDLSGLFILDVTTERNIVQHFHTQTFAENQDDYSYIWKNVYSRHNQICHTSLTFFIREGDLFHRFEEIHIQKIFEVKTVNRRLEQAGYKMLSAYDMYTFNRWSRHSDRINLTARKEEEIG
ncbi:MAG: class I SAM-dependent methyltransferase [Candidatus Poribacteria bacterium]|nr:class I SAM-dependent methyltransferase [Candidatus Poribacteria bacterium]